VTSYGWLHAILAKDDHPRFTVSNATETALVVGISIDGIASRFALSGPPAEVQAIARDWLALVTAATDELGETCIFCARRGLSFGEFARPHGPFVFEHVGCAMDRARLLAEAERERLDILEATE